MNCDDCLESEMENYQNGSVLCMTVMHNDVHTHMSSS